MAKKRMRQVLMPDYVKDFQCIGSACEDTCCSFWKVPVDQQTYARYERLPEAQDRERILRHLNPDPAPSLFSAASIQLVNGYCPFLTGERLCSLQQELGEQYLGAECRTFPRTFGAVDGQTEVSLRISCPEAARQLLLRPQGIKFIREIQEESTLLTPTWTVETKGPEAVRLVNQHFWPIRRLGLSLLQNRTYTIPERLRLFGWFCGELDRLVESGRAADTPALLAQVKDLAGSGKIRDVLTPVPVTAAQHLTLLVDLLTGAMRDQRGVQRMYQECLNLVASGLGSTSRLEVGEAQVERYTQARKRYWEPFRDQYAYIWENYLVNYTFGSMFPRIKPTLFSGYQRMLLHYALIEMQATAIASALGQLTPEWLIRLIYGYGRQLEQNETAVNTWLEMMEVRQLNTLAGCDLLIGPQV